MNEIVPPHAYVRSSKVSDMSEWRIGKLGELATGIRGVAYTPEQLREFKSPGTVTLLRSNNIQSGWIQYKNIQIVLKGVVSEAQILRLGDIAVCMSNGSKALVGKAGPFVELTNEQFTVGAFCSIFRPVSGVDHQFAKYIFQSNAYRAQLDISLAGSAINNLRNSELELFSIGIPPRPHQKKIAEVLGALDAAIRHTDAIIEKLKQVKQGLLYDLLTRGIDASGELRPPQSQAPHLYSDSSLGWLPVEWHCVPTSALCSLITKGTTPAAGDMWQGEDGIRFLRVDNLSFDGKFNLLASNFRTSQWTHRRELSRSRCFPGDVLTNIVGPPLGKLGLVTVETGEVNINQAIALFRPSLELSSGFLLLWLSSSTAQSWLRSRAKQTSGQLNLTLALCQELPIPHMCLDEQQRIVDRVEAAQNRIMLEECELVKLRKLKDGLMDDLLTGRVRVKQLFEALGI